MLPLRIFMRSSLSFSSRRLPSSLTLLIAVISNSSGPKRLAKAICSARVRCWPGKISSAYFSQASCSAWKVSSSISGMRKPVTTAPKVASTGSILRGVAMSPPDNAGRTIASAFDRLESRISKVEKVVGVSETVDDHRLALARLAPIALVRPDPDAAHHARGNDHPPLDHRRLLGTLGQAAIGNRDRLDVAVVEDGAHLAMAHHELDESVVELVHVRRCKDAGNADLENAIFPVEGQPQHS